MAGTPWHPKGRQLAVDEIIAHLYYAMETNDLEATEFYASLIHHHEIIRWLDTENDLRKYLISLGYFKPLVNKYKKYRDGEKKQGRIHREFNPKIF